MALSRHTLIEPPIETLLDKVDSKFTLVTLAARRGRQINAYYGSLGSEFGRVAPPQVTSTSEKALSIAFEEISAGKVGYIRVDPEQEAAEIAAEAAANAEAARDAADLFGTVSADAPAPTTEI